MQFLRAKFIKTNFITLHCALFFLTSREDILLGGPFFLSTSLVNSSTMEGIVFSLSHDLDSSKKVWCVCVSCFILRFLDVKYFVDTCFNVSSF